MFNPFVLYLVSGPLVSSVYNMSGQVIVHLILHGREYEKKAQKCTRQLRKVIWNMIDEF